MALASPTTEPAPSPTATATTIADLAAADLDGVLVDPAFAHRLPIAVSIDDNRIARPQSGFNGASIVWHAPADGFETRYLLVFQEGDSDDVGPVRSARIYFAEWAAELRAALGHYGGDRLSRRWVAEVRGDLLWSVDGIGAGNPAYHRIGERDAPHNAYTSTADLRAMADRLRAPDSFDGSVHVRPFRDDAPSSERGVAQTVVVPYKTVSVAYTYDPETNSYARTLDGRPHVDAADGETVTARTVVVLFATFRLDSTIEPGHARPVLGSIGTGRALVISEGRTIEGSWSKADAAGPTVITDADGVELPLIRGRIFIQVVPIGTRVTT